MKKNFPRIATAIILSVALPASFTHAPTAAAATNIQATSSLEEQGIPLHSEEEVLALLSVVESIPDEVLLQGDEATHEWLSTQIAYQPRMDKFQCGVAIAALLVSTAVPAAKLLKLKRLVKSLGGAKAAAKIFWDNRGDINQLRALGGAIKDLVDELSGIADVREHCFN